MYNDRGSLLAVWASNLKMYFLFHCLLGEGFASDYCPRVIQKASYVTCQQVI